MSGSLIPIAAAAVDATVAHPGTVAAAPIAPIAFSADRRFMVGVGNSARIAPPRQALRRKKTQSELRNRQNAFRCGEGAPTSHLADASFRAFCRRDFPDSTISTAR